MTSITTGRDVYQPISPFTANIPGEGDVTFTQYTYVREGHWILDKYPELFRPVRVRYDVEEATDRPGVKRGA